MLLIIPLISNAQTKPEVFTSDEKGYLFINSKIEKDLLVKIKPQVQKKIEKIKASGILDNEHITSLTDYSKDLEFIKDTIQLNTFIENFEQDYISESYTTLGMTVLSSYRQDYYEKLIDKYYNKALNTLNDKLKDELITNQKLWFAFNKQHLDMLYDLNKNAGTMSYIYGEQWRKKNLIERSIFLKDIYVGKFLGDNVYKYE